MADTQRIAYFSMEVALCADIPTYSGGLGVLAGDTIRAAADHRIPMVAISLLHRKGYFYQSFDGEGKQTESPVLWPVDDFVQELSTRVSVQIEGREVHIRAWKYEVQGISGSVVPVYLLDSDLPENHEPDRALTDFLYGGDSHYRLCQEIVLGVGGVRMLRALGCKNLTRFHLNEGHASFLTIELLEERLRAESRTLPTSEDIQAIKNLCVFTTHTPIPAGHDKFPMEMVYQTFGHRELFQNTEIFCQNDTLNMTYLGLNLSHYVNGVAKQHGKVSQRMFPNYAINHITNGVHAATWVAPSFAQLFDDYIPGWREDNFSLRHASGVPAEETWQTHLEAKEALLRYINRGLNGGFDKDVLTIGFARRMTGYKRPELLFTDVERLNALTFPLQILYSGKAHPRDEGGKELIRHIFEARKNLKPHIKLAFLPNYDLELAKLLTAGVDLWLNTPQKPLEASGTSGMKAALNGVPSLSILDGWWIEGWIEGVTGWAINPHYEHGEHQNDVTIDSKALYDKLEQVIAPMFYNDRARYISVMQNAIALNGSFFNTQRMIEQYIVNAYFC